VAPRVRIGNSKWFNLLWLLPIGFVLVITAVAVAKGLRGVPTVAEFIRQYPGRVVPPGAEGRAGFPVWIGWQHFFNMLLLIPIILRVSHPCRSSPAVLDPALNPGQGMVPDAKTGAC
jgi:hypothetical protein